MASATLDAVIKDLTVSLKFAESTYSPDAETTIVEAMAWRTSRVPKAALLLEQLSLPGLIQTLHLKDTNRIKQITTAEGVRVFNATDSEAIVKVLSQPAVRFKLDQAPVFDVPKLTITGFTIRAGKKVPLIRDFTRLSFGQQQSVLLALMLSSKSSVPLIVDQPEDNLDSEFIYRTLVPVLRLAKERRQIIIVTHNPNIAVLGDAEQIIILKSTNDKSSIVCRGSIDDEETKNTACNVLEGAREAFQTRARIYGVP